MVIYTGRLCVCDKLNPCILPPSALVSGEGFGAVPLFFSAISVLVHARVLVLLAEALYSYESEEQKVSSAEIKVLLTVQGPWNACSQRFILLLKW